MSDLISRQAAIDALECVGYDFSESGLSNPELEELCEAIGDVEQDMIMRIKRLPSAQPEVIRCKECKEFRRYIDTDITFCDRTESERKPDDFCSRAERRTDG